MIEERMKAIRLDKGMTQTQVAKLMGMDTSTYSRMEGERRKATLPECKRFATVMQVPLPELLGLPRPEQQHGDRDQRDQRSGMSDRGLRKLLQQKDLHIVDLQDQVRSLMHLLRSVVSGTRVRRSFKDTSGGGNALRVRGMLVFRGSFRLVYERWLALCHGFLLSRRMNSTDRRSLTS